MLSPRAIHPTMTDRPQQTDCQCTGPVNGEPWFWCKRHKCRKTKHWQELCRNRPAYFQAWEKGMGPGQSRASESIIAASNSQGKVSVGAGTELKRLLHWLGIVPTFGCGCGVKASLMDERGPDWCLENMDMIVGWMEEEATKRQLPYTRAGARVLVRLAVRAARKKLKILAKR